MSNLVQVRKPKRRAFTVIDLAAVVTVLGMMLTVLLPVYWQAQERARREACLANALSFSVATVTNLGDDAP